MLELQLRFKRVIDTLLAAVLLTLLSPLLLAIALLVRFSSPGPILYSQLRSGLKLRPYRIYKYRTMCVDAPHLRNPDGSAMVVRHDPRVTPPGRWLRDFSLDELPQLWNVLCGDMSLVGPRPEMVEYAIELPDWAREKFRMRPGCFSLTLIRGRNNLSWQARNEIDLEYVSRYSLWLDVQIICLGIWCMLITRTGSYCPPEFDTAATPARSRDV
jgi:lipopolysaccharide/colanic/teichoic acid biosynthesis glycosyltransferase